LIFKEFLSYLKVKIFGDFMQTDDVLEWICQYCGVENSVWVDLTIEGKQDFIEDCRICCRPNRIIVVRDYDGNVMIEARPIDE
jgi:hypothetical protein